MFLLPVNLLTYLNATACSVLYYFQPPEPARRLIFSLQGCWQLAITQQGRETVTLIGACFKIHDEKRILRVKPFHCYQFRREQAISNSPTDAVGR